MLGNRRLSGQSLLLIVVAAVALFAGAGVALAATAGGSDPAAAGATTTPSPAPSLPGRMHGAGPGRPAAGWPGGGFRPGGAGMAGFGTVHGQFVVAKPGGGYQTVDLQRGSVTAVTGSSITVRSSDGFGKTYQVPAAAQVNAQRNGIGSIRKGDQVMVIATVSGGTATATRILDFSLLPRQGGGAAGGGWPGFAGPGPGASAPAAPAPAASAG
jgi:hypothetical protein